jgi:hypothetical protein
MTDEYGLSTAERSASGSERNRDVSQTFCNGNSIRKSILGFWNFGLGVYWHVSYFMRSNKRQSKVFKWLL